MYGAPQLDAPAPAKCAIVKLLAESERTNVRADTSGTQGTSREIVTDARLLFRPTVSVGMGDKIEVAGYTLRVVGVFPRHNVHGQLDHYQVDANVWA